MSRLRPYLPLPAAARVLLGALVLLGVAAGPAAAQGVLHVDADAAPGGDGASWATAFDDLQDALAIAQAGDEVWVAEGVYRPTEGSDREATFVLASGVALYGGFDGTEQHRDERDWAVNVTILSGDIGVPGDSTDNAYHVVTASGVDRTAILDGFTVERGRANATAAPHDRGAGMLAVGGSPTVRNGRFFRNVIGLPVGGEKLGGGIYVEDGSPLVEDTVFEENSAIGGGLYASGGAPELRRVSFRRNGGNALTFADGSTGLVEDGLIEQHTRQSVFVLASSPVFRRVTFRDNVTGPAPVDGPGALINDGAAPVFEDCLFENLRTRNDLAGSGGGVFVRWDGEVSRPVFIRTTFRGNTASQGGGIRLHPSDALFLFCRFEGNRARIAAGLAGYQTAVTVIGSTFVGNHAEVVGGGLDLAFAPLVGGRSLVASTLFSGNTAEGRGGAMSLGGTGTVPVDLVNVTFAGNAADEGGGGVYLSNAAGVALSNVVLWGNTAPEGPEVYVEAGVGPTVERAIIEGGCPLGATCTDILDADPLFERAPSPGPDGEWGTEDDDYGDLRLRPGSPGLDAGLAALLPPDRWDLDGDGDFEEPLPIDVVGDPRVQGEEVDLGAYEHPPVVASEPGAEAPSLRVAVRPNPVRASSAVVLTLPEAAGPARGSGAVSVSVYDVLGRRVAVLHEGPLGAGEHALPLDATSLPAGVYVVRVSVGSAAVTQTVTVLR